MPDLEGGVITADALHLQVETIAQVVEDKNGHVLVGLKGNRGRLLNEVTDAFAQSGRRQQLTFRTFFGRFNVINLIDG